MLIATPAAPVRVPRRSATAGWSCRDRSPPPSDQAINRWKRKPQRRRECSDEGVPIDIEPRLGRQAIREDVRGRGPVVVLDQTAVDRVLELKQRWHGPPVPGDDRAMSRRASLHRWAAEFQSTPITSPGPSSLTWARQVAFERPSLTVIS